MQTFSDLRRKSPNALSLSFILLIFGLVIYQMLSTAFTFLPPLFGVFFTYIILTKKEAERLLSGLAMPWFAIFGVFIFAEQLHGFFFLSSVMVYALFYHVFFEAAVINIKSRIFLMLGFNITAYGGIWGLSNLILYMLDKDLLKYSSEYIYFILVESAICLFLFRKSKL